MKEQRIIRGVFCLFVMAVAFGAQGKEKPISPISWGRCLRQKPEFYASDEAIRIADNVLLYQRDTGGWPSNINMTRKLTENEKDKIRKAKGKEDSTIDNKATHTQIRYLAKVYEATKLERFKQGFYNGVDYL
ncbi:MAG: pectate lyase, partial [Phycisphaerae bacterium]